MKWNQHAPASYWSVLLVLYEARSLKRSQGRPEAVRTTDTFMALVTCLTRGRVGAGGGKAGVKQGTWPVVQGSGQLHRAGGGGKGGVTIAVPVQLWHACNAAPPTFQNSMAVPMPVEKSTTWAQREGRGKGVTARAGAPPRVSQQRAVKQACAVCMHSPD